MSADAQRANPYFETAQAKQKEASGDIAGAEAEYKKSIADADSMPAALHKEYQDFIAEQSKKFKAKQDIDQETALKLKIAFSSDHASFFGRIGYGQFLVKQGRDSEAQTAFQQADTVDHNLYLQFVQLQQHNNPETAPTSTHHLSGSEAMHEVLDAGKHWAKDHAGSLAALGAGMGVGLLMSWSGPGAIAAGLAAASAAGAALGTGVDGADGKLKGASGKTITLDFLKHGFEGLGGAVGPAAYHVVGAELGIASGALPGASLATRVGLMGLRGAATVGSVSLVNRTASVIGKVQDGKQDSIRGDAKYIVGGALWDSSMGFAGGTGGVLIGGAVGTGLGAAKGIWEQKGIKDSKQFAMTTGKGTLEGIGSAMLFRFIQGKFKYSPTEATVPVSEPELSLFKRYAMAAKGASQESAPASAIGNARAASSEYSKPSR